MAPAISPNGWLKLAARRLYAISSPALTLLAPMARPNALSRLPCANGLMPVRISIPRARLLVSFFPASLQLAPTSLRSRPAPTNLKTQLEHEQPLEPSHLEKLIK